MLIHISIDRFDSIRYVQLNLPRLRFLHQIYDFCKPKTIADMAKILFSHLFQIWQRRQCNKEPNLRN